MSQLYCHLVWATWDRLPLITPNIEASLHAALAVEFRRLGCTVLEIGGTENHVHCVVGFPVTVSVAEMVKQVKGASSHLMTHDCTGPGGFKWQGSYSAFSLHRTALPKVREYVANQKAHHSSGATQEGWERTSEEDPSRR